MIALSPTPILRSERLVLRAPSAQDLAHWRAFHLTDRPSFIRVSESFDEQAVWRAWAAVIGHWVMRGWGPFVLTRHDDDRGLGLVGPWQPHGWPEAEILWQIWDAELEGKGFAAEAATLVRQHLYTDLGWATAVSYIAQGNARSITLAERLGCTLDSAAPSPEGKPCLVYRHPKPEDLA